MLTCSLRFRCLPSSALAPFCLLFVSPSRLSAVPCCFPVVSHVSAFLRRSIQRLRVGYGEAWVNHSGMASLGTLCTPSSAPGGGARISLSRYHETLHSSTHDVRTSTMICPHSTCLGLTRSHMCHARMQPFTVAADVSQWLTPLASRWSGFDRIRSVLALPRPVDFVPCSLPSIVSMRFSCRTPANVCQCLDDVADRRWPVPAGKRLRQAPHRSFTGCSQDGDTARERLRKQRLLPFLPPPQPTHPVRSA